MWHNRLLFYIGLVVVTSCQATTEKLHLPKWETLTRNCSSVETFRSSCSQQLNANISQWHSWMRINSDVVWGLQSFHGDLCDRPEQHVSVLVLQQTCIKSKLALDLKRAFGWIYKDERRKLDVMHQCNDELMLLGNLGLWSRSQGLCTKPPQYGFKQRTPQRIRWRRLLWPRRNTAVHLVLVPHNVHYMYLWKSFWSSFYACTPGARGRHFSPDEKLLTKFISRHRSKQKPLGAERAVMITHGHVELSSLPSSLQFFCFWKLQESTQWVIRNIINTIIIVWLSSLIVFQYVQQPHSGWGGTLH